MRVKIILMILDRDGLTVQSKGKCQSYHPATTVVLALIESAL